MNIRKTILIAMVFCADLTWACQAKSIRITAKEKRVKALELLNKYEETQNKQQSYKCKWKIIANMNAKLSEPPYSALSGKSRKIQLIECRYDGNRYAERIHKWGNIRSSKIFIPKDRGPYNSILWDGRMYYNYVATVDKPGRLGIYGSIEDLSNKNTRNNHKINSRFGPCSGLVNVYDLNLRKIPTLSVRDKTEKIKGIDCYVIEAADKNVKYALWIDPEHGYNTAQWQLEYSNMNLHVSLENVRFQRIDNVWIIVKGIVNRREYFRNGDFTSETKHCELTEMILNPDHDALDSFCLDDVLDGAIVLFHGKSYDHTIAATGGLSRKGHGEVVDEQGRVVSYTWYNGKFMDSAGKLFSLDEVCAIPKLLDKLLPDLKDFNVDLSLEEVKDKIMLVCFWNMNQRPSRNCIMQLAKQSKQLKEKDLIIIAVHTSNVDEKLLNEWVKENCLPFQVGMIQDDEEKTRFNWGVKSLPWLILTDQKHIVTAEGFGIDELDDKIRQTSNRN